MNTNYDVDYFIKKFEAIPEERWVTDSFHTDDGYCANGHCGVTQNDIISLNEEASAFNNLFKSLLPVTIIKKQTVYPLYQWGLSACINDGLTENYKQPTPKQRILSALYDIKKSQEPKVKEVIRYVSVPESIKEQSVLLSEATN